MKKNRVQAIGAVVAVLWAGAALAQTWAPPAEIAPKQGSQAQAAPAPTPAPAPVVAEQKPAAAAPATKKDKAKDCKAQADAKGLHGKERKKFNAECMKL